MIKKIFDIFNIVLVSIILFLLFYYIFNNYIFESRIYFKSTFYGIFSGSILNIICIVIFISFNILKLNMYSIFIVNLILILFVVDVINIYFLYKLIKKKYTKNNLYLYQYLILFVLIFYWCLIGTLSAELLLGYNVGV